MTTRVDKRRDPTMVRLWNSPWTFFVLSALSLLGAFSYHGFWMWFTLVGSVAGMWMFVTLGNERWKR